MSVIAFDCANSGSRRMRRCRRGLYSKDYVHGSASPERWSCVLIFAKAIVRAGDAQRSSRGTSPQSFRVFFLVVFPATVNLRLVQQLRC